ncbi:MAG: hypothetical protein JRF33_06850 [Deltaproteobacteria bacterium]|nr:hypothetical protein [Deltaproteobacteria bacterium]
MKRFLIWPLGLFLVCALSFGACSDDTAGNDVDGGGDDGSSNVSDGGDAGETGDVQRTDGGSFSDDFNECVSVAETATNTRGPADVIIAVDNTPSMYNEIEEVRANLNRFSDMVVAEGLDLHIVLIGCFSDDCLNSTNWHTICIDPPLGTEGACDEAGNTDDSNPPNFLHVNSKVESTWGLLSIIDTFDQWQGMLRLDAAKHVIMISDDNDSWSAEQFNTDFLALDSRLAGYQFHGIFSYMDKDAGCAMVPEDPCCTYSAPDGEGVIYRELAEMTGGLTGDMCLQDFDSVFDQFATAVVDSARLKCEWVIPEPPDNMTLEVDLVNLEFTDDTGDRFQIGRVESVDACLGVEHGWYFDDLLDPTMIYVCPQTCDWLQGKVGAQIDVQFGCETIWET